LASGKKQFKFSNVRNTNPLQCRGLKITPDPCLRIAGAGYDIRSEVEGKHTKKKEYPISNKEFRMMK
jgi:hypothetical protein